jgi:hypothetical protein
MVDHELVHIAVAPPARADEGLVNSVAAIINKSPTSTRLLLAGEVPKIVFQTESLPDAEAIAENLRRLGLAVLALPDAELRQLPPVFEAQTLELGDEEALFRDDSGAEKRMSAGDVFLILIGRVESSVEVERERSKRKFSWGRTIMLGGIPAWKKVKETVTDKSSLAEDFARLYSRKSNEPGVELRQHRLNYSFLGAERAASSVLNFTTVVRRLREAFPEAIFDERLAKRLILDESSSWQDVELNCRLIYLFHTMQTK